MSTSRAARRRPPGSPFKDAVAAPVEVFEVGDRVTHDRCGLGRVVGVEPDVAVQVEFGQQTYRVLSPYRELTKH
jgi:hypothetical protein